MEMNTRIQVEHPVTEMVTGIDLVKEQIRVAAGRAAGRIRSGPITPARPRHRVPRSTPRIRTRSRPSPGTITDFHLPGGPGVRVDTTATRTTSSRRYYDSLIAKLIVHGHDRARGDRPHAARARQFVVEGIKTSIPLHRRILGDPDFAAGRSPPVSWSASSSGADESPRRAFR